MTKTYPDDKKICAGTSPLAVDVVAGERYFWCSCGRSKNQPLCDGSHKTETRSSSGALKWVATESETKYFCTCKETKTPPFCDGSHNELSNT